MKYTNIFTAYDDNGYIELFFYNQLYLNALLFDGFNFILQNSVLNVPSRFNELKGISSIDHIYQIEQMKQSDDMTFIKFTNGDIFQLHFIPYGNNGLKQVLSIFNKVNDSNTITPLGISTYEAAMKRFNAADVCEISNG